MPNAYEYDEAESRKTERIYLTPEIIRQRAATMEALHLQAGERVVDVGCGPGLLTLEMALAVGKHGCVLGIDNSQPMLSIARTRCEGLDQVRIEDGDATKIKEESDSFDAVGCIQVLLYVTAVRDALAEMRRVLRPGGRIAIIETDWSGTVLNSSNETLTRKIIGAWDLEMPNPRLPAQLGPLLRSQGFDSLQVRAITIINTSFDADGFSAQLMNQFAESARKFGVSDESETTEWLDDLRRLGEEGSYFFCFNRFLFTAVKL